MIQSRPIKSTPDKKSSMSLPPDWGDDALSKYMQKAISNVPATFIHNKSKYERLADIDCKFSTIYKGFRVDEWPTLLIVRAHVGYRVACQLTMSGHITESAPVLRSCLEYSLYALHINKNTAKAKAWQKAMESENKQDGDNSPPKSISRKFSMGKLKRTLKKADPELLPYVADLNQRTIDFGGHPNRMAMVPNLAHAENDGKSTVTTTLMHDNPLAIEGGMAFAAEAGFACLLIFKNIFPERFTGCGVDVTIEDLKQERSSQKDLYPKQRFLATLPKNLWMQIASRLTLFK